MRSKEEKHIVGTYFIFTMGKKLNDSPDCVLEKED